MYILVSIEFGNCYKKDESIWFRLNGSPKNENDYK